MWFMGWETINEISFLIAMVGLLITEHLREIGKKLYNE